MDAAEREAWSRADELLAELLELPGERRREALAAMAPPPAVRRCLESLLAAAEQEEGPLDAALAWSAPVHAAAEPLPTLTGRRLGPYLLDEELGRGGMAVVYRAHRADGTFAQEVAVKVLGVGLLPLGGGERFRREQQLLSRLRHPRIATMLDGGVAEDGTPWLAMELLRGQPIDDWCAERRPSARQRVALVLQVCEAVSFAHRNLVVHRDLKPSNIFVDQAGPTHGQVKLLDFGIAKLLASDADLAPVTVAQVRFLTPGYAAPEQVDGGAVTTATDVFALGRVLERLLAAAPAVDDADLRNVAHHAARAEPELRYADAAALAADLERWRDGRPVVATGNRLSYRLRKLVRRRRAAIAGAALVLAVAIAGGAATLWQAARARREARAAETVNAFLLDLFHASNPERARGEDPPASELLRRGAERAEARLAAEPLLQGQLLHTIGTIQREVGQPAAAERSLARALTLRARHLDGVDPALASTRVELGLTRYELGRVDEAVALMRQALADLERTLEPGDRRRLDAAVRLGDMLVVQGKFAEARRLEESVLARIGTPSAELAELAYDAEYTLGVALGELGETAAAAKTLQRLVDGERRRSGGLSPDLALYANEYGLLLHDLGDAAGAERAYREALAIKRRFYGADHNQVSAQLLNLGMALGDQGRKEEALAMLQESLAINRRVHGDRHPQVAAALEAVGWSLVSQQRLADARAPFAEAVAIWRALPPGAADPAMFANALRNYGGLLVDLGEPALGEPVLRESVERYASLEGAEPMRRPLAQARLGEALVALGRHGDGVELLGPALGALETSGYGWDKPGYATLQLAAARGEAALGRHQEAQQRVAAVRSHLDRAEGAAWDRVHASLARTAAAMKPESPP
jgi:serine/threonine-protein kinase